MTQKKTGRQKPRKTASKPAKAQGNRKKTSLIKNGKAGVAIQPQGKRYILLPANEIRSSYHTSRGVKSLLTRLAGAAETMESLTLRSVKNIAVQESPVQIKVVGSIQENGAKLVDILEDDLPLFRMSYPGLRIIPEQFYRRAFRHEPVKFPKIRRAAVAVEISINCTVTIKDISGNVIPGVYVADFTDFAAKAGDSGTTNAEGAVELGLNSKKIERLYVYPSHTYWGHLKADFLLSVHTTIELQKIEKGYRDALRHFYPSERWKPLANPVRIAIIDTGFGPHSDVVVKKAMNLVLGEAESDFQDLEGHGTHVAGIISCTGVFAGLANGAELYVYRVFPEGQNASGFDIMKAINQAKADKCDLVNMSLGESGLDEAIVSAIKDAYSAGVLCFAANGNDHRSPVNFPAAYGLTIAVSAMGRTACFPAGAVQTGEVQEPFGTDNSDFIAAFSNTGGQTDLVAPGVGIISSYPNDQYAVMDGTSMACPAAVAIAARILAGRPDILDMPRNEERTDAIQKLLAAHTKKLGFGATFEGNGMLFLG